MTQINITLASDDAQTLADYSQFAKVRALYTLAQFHGAMWDAAQQPSPEDVRDAAGIAVSPDLYFVSNEVQFAERGGRRGVSDMSRIEDLTLEVLRHNGITTALADAGVHPAKGFDELYQEVRTASIERAKRRDESDARQAQAVKDQVAQAAAAISL